MEKRPLITVIALLCMMFVSAFVLAQDMKSMTLPKPQKTGGMPLKEALGHRMTNRTFKTDMLSNQELSDLLWSACDL